MMMLSLCLLHLVLGVEGGLFLGYGSGAGLGKGLGAGAGSGSYAKLVDDFNNLMTNASAEGLVPKSDAVDVTVPADAILNQFFLLRGESVGVNPTLKSNMGHLTTVVQTLQNNLLSEHNKVQAEVNKMVEGVQEACSSSPDSNKFEEAYTQGVKDFHACELTVVNKAKGESPCEAHVKALKDAETVACEQTGPLAWTPEAGDCEPAGGEIEMGHWYLSNAVKFEKMREDWKAAKKVCTDAETARKNEECDDDKEGEADVVKDCDTTLDALEAASCNAALSKLTACKSYDTCFDEKKAKYAGDEVTYKQKEASRKLQWRMTSRFKCLFESAGTGVVDKAALGKCADMGKYDTKHLVLTFPEFPKKDTCTKPTVYPGTALYHQEVYGNLPAGTTPRAPIKCEGITADGKLAAGAAPAAEKEGEEKAE